MIAGFGNSNILLPNLVLVAGHAIPRRFDRLETDEGWFLKSFQVDEGSLYLEHIRRGVDVAAADPESLLLFAGGQTDAAAGPRSEGQGYWLAAEQHNWFGHPEVRDRATTEEFSLDSFQNLMFGICRYKEVTGGYPEQVVALGWKFKGPRFEIHREALRFPGNRFRYEGVNDPPSLAVHLPFEQARISLFRQDPYGVTPDAAHKRSVRNVFRRQHGYRSSNPELTALLDHEGPKLFAGPLPWTLEKEER